MNEFLPKIGLGLKRGILPSEYGIDSKNLIHPAGPGNTSRYVYEYLGAGDEFYIEARARPDATDLTVPLSDDSALDQWQSPFIPGNAYHHHAEYAHLYVPGVYVLVGDTATMSLVRYVLVEQGTAAQRRLNPSNPTIPEADKIYKIA